MGTALDLQVAYPLWNNTGKYLALSFGNFQKDLSLERLNCM